MIVVCHPSRSMVLAFALAVVTAVPAFSQSRVSFSGEVFADYFYVVTSADGASDGMNAFQYRRAYLTTDYVISDQFDGRIRMETNGSSGSAGSRPAPFEKDMYVRWKNALGEGHNVIFGVQGPPNWAMSERHWGYRSLDQTIMDRSGIASSRDTGIQFMGPVTTSKSIRYAVMVGNNSGVSRDSDKYKRLYGQLEFYPTDRFRATIGSNYAPGDTDDLLMFNGFAGWTTEDFTLGAEGFYGTTSVDGASDDVLQHGVSLFGTYHLSKTRRLIARFDSITDDDGTLDATNTYFLGGMAFLPHADVQVIPNIIYTKNSTESDPGVTARMTLYVTF